MVRNVSVLKIFKYLLLIPFNIIWYLQLIIIRNDKLWIFGGWFGHKYSDNAKILYEYVCKNNKEITAVWITRRKEIKERLISEGKLSVLSTSMMGIWYSLRAGYVIYSSGIQDINPYFINGAIIVNTWHGAPMKKIGFDDKLSRSKLLDNLLPVLYPFLTDRLDGLVSTSEIFNKKLSSAFKISVDKILCSGYPRNDLLYSRASHLIINQWNKKFNNPGKILYLPTFRSLQAKFKPFDSYGFNDNSWEQFLKDRNLILISKGHFVDKEIGRESMASRIIHLSDNNIEDINLLMKDVDLLITDYSGAYFDFLLTNKKIIFAPFDYDDYITKSRELYFDYNKIVSGPVVFNWPDVQKSIDGLFTCDDYASIRKEKCAIFNKFSDANNSERLFRMIINLG